MTTTHDTRQHILQAASRIVKRDGVARLTIDAVAREAGLSKGGVLYHFASKEALIEGMIGGLLEEFEQDMARVQAQEEPGPGRWLRAYIRTTCDPVQEDLDSSQSLIAAISTYPHLLEPVRERFAQWQLQVEADGLPPEQATILRLAVDGLWLADLFGLAPPSGPQRAALVQSLLDMTHPHSQKREP